MKVRWHRDAINDLGDIERFIERDNPRAARAVRSKISAAVRTLATHPRLGRIGRIPGTRELVVSGTPYIVGYEVAGGRVTVLAVLHASQKWPEAL